VALLMGGGERGGGGYSLHGPGAVLARSGLPNSIEGGTRRFSRNVYPGCFRLQPVAPTLSPVSMSGPSSRPSPRALSSRSPSMSVSNIGAADLPGGFEERRRSCVAGPSCSSSQLYGARGGLPVPTEDVVIHEERICSRDRDSHPHNPAHRFAARTSVDVQGGHAVQHADMSGGIRITPRAVADAAGDPSERCPRCVHRPT